MSEQADSHGQTVTGWRFKAGIALFALSIILPVAGIPAIATLGLSTAVTTTVSGALLFGAEIIGILSIAIMGKPGYNYIKTTFFGFLRRYGPAATVSSARYRIGLMIFCMPFIFAWVSVYLSGFIPGFESNPVAWAISGDVLLIISLFVLGGDFWDKIRALFVHDARVNFPGETLKQS